MKRSFGKSRRHQLRPLLLTVALAGLFSITETPLTAEILHDWKFNDPAGETLKHSKNESSPLTFWSQAWADSETTGEGTFRIQRNRSGQNSRFDIGPWPGNSTLYLVVDIAGWDFPNVIDRNPQLRFSFMNGLTDDTPSEITAEMRLSRQNSGRLTLQARAEGPGGETFPAESLFESKQKEPVRLALGYSPLHNSYQIRYRIGTDPWQLLQTGSTSPDRSGPSIRMYVLGDLEGEGENYFELDRVFLTTNSPFTNGSDPFFLDEGRSVSGTLWDLTATPLFIANQTDQRAGVSILQNGKLESGFTALGRANRAIARIALSGDGSSWILRDGDLRIAEHPGSSGIIEVKDRATATFGKTGNAPNRFGPGRTFVGYAGNGRLQISSGAKVSSENAVYVAPDAASNGRIELSGTESSFEINSNLHISASLTGNPSEGSGFVGIRENASLSVAGNLTLQKNGELNIEENASALIANRLDLKAGSSLNLKNGTLQLNGPLQIDSDADFLWTSGKLISTDLISGLHSIPPDSQILLASQDAAIQSKNEERLQMSNGSKIIGSGSILQSVDLGNENDSLISGDSSGPIRLFGNLSGSGKIENGRILGNLYPNKNGLQLQNVSFAGDATLHIEIDKSAPTVSFDSSTDFTGARLEVSFTNSAGSETEYQLFDFLDGDAKLPPFHSIHLPDGWELIDGTLRLTDAPSVKTYEEWAETFGLTGPAADPEADPDNDGLDNRGEFLLGGDPQNALRDEIKIFHEGESTLLRWRERLAGDGVYLPEWSEDLLAWQPAFPSFTYSQAKIRNSNHPGYRSVEWPVDSNKDRGFFRIIADTAPAAPIYPGKEWESIEDPESVGFSQNALDFLEGYLSQMDTSGFMAILGGRVLFSYGDLEVLSYSASTRKSILAMLYGRYVDSGKIDLDATLEELGIDDNLGLLPIEKQATIHDLLRARSGIYHPRSNTGDNWETAPPRGSQTPGDYYLYNNWDFNALGTIFTQLSGKTPYEALETDFSRILEMEDFSLEAQRWGGDLALSQHRAYYFTLSTRDMARLGYLMLRNGNWKGEQLISENWMEQMLHPWTPAEEMNPASRRTRGIGYSYLWWLREVEEESPYFGSCAAHGAGGQYIMVIPKLDMVFAHKTLSSGTDLSVSRTQFYDLVDLFVSELM